MTVLDSGLVIALLLALVALLIVGRYAQLEHRRRLKKASDAFRLGGSQKIGDISQLLGTFDVLTEYDEITLLSSTSAQSSMDLLGRKGNRLDFIEFKKAGTPLTKAERALKGYIDAGELKVAYRILDVKWPDEVSVKERS
ncbi:MAG: hypothetical protein JRN06_05985 [Nitrososphaerota archaeon]|nr:hypothetical protein [Nitrososphaerota archaeon]